MGKCKTKAIQTNLGRFRHNQAYSKTCVNLAYSEPGISRTLTYSKRKYMQNPSIFRTLAYWRLWHILNPRFIQTSTMSNIYDEVFCENSWRKIVPQYKLAAFSTSWNKYHEVVTPEIVILCKKNYCTRGCRGPWNFHILIDIFK